MSAGNANAREVTALAEVKVRKEAEQADILMSESTLSFKDISNNQIRVEKLKEQYDVVGTTRFDSAINELISLEDSAFSDQQLLIQGNPKDRNMMAFGDAVVREAQRNKIIRKLEL